MKRTALGLLALAFLLEGGFWGLEQYSNIRVALIGLVSFVCAGWISDMIARRRQALLLPYLVASASALATTGGPARHVREVMEELAHQAGVRAPVVEVWGTASASGGAETRIAGDIALVRVSEALATGDVRRLRAGLAHELGHVVLRPSLPSRLGPAGFMLIVSIFYALSASAFPLLIWIPKIAILLIGVALSLGLGIFLDEEKADKFAVKITGDREAMADYLSANSGDRLTALVHSPRRRALRPSDK